LAEKKEDVEGGRRIRLRQAAFARQQPDYGESRGYGATKGKSESVGGQRSEIGYQ
jgi:hypothetical protein